jgi:CRP-like cAMP-binding protein
MEPQLWIGIQVFLDLLMVALLVWFLVSCGKRQASWQNHEAAIRKSEAILAEITEITQALEVNLQEKRELSSRILAQLEQGLKKAEEIRLQISKIIPKTGRTTPGPANLHSDPQHTRSSVQALLAKGLTREEVARHLGISVGEIDLLLKLWPQSGQRP